MFFQDVELDLWVTTPLPLMSTTEHSGYRLCARHQFRSEYWALLQGHSIVLRVREPLTPLVLCLCIEMFRSFALRTLAITSEIARGRYKLPHVPKFTENLDWRLCLRKPIATCLAHFLLLILRKIKTMAQPRHSLTVLISGSGTNLQALIDACGTDALPNTNITHVISKYTSLPSPAKLQLTIA